MTDVKKSGSKTYSLMDGFSVKSTKENETWGEFDEDWGFRINDVPEKFRTEQKFENFKLSKQEEYEKKLTLKSKPYQIVIEPTNVCNLHCPLCPTGIGAETRKQGVLPLERFKKLIDSIKDTVLQLSLQNWGESTIVPQLPEMIKYASDNGIYTLISSNFSIKYSDHFLESLIKSGLGRLQIDIDGTTQDVYEKYRIGGNLETVLSNTRKVMKIKKENNLEFPIIQSRMIIMKHNEHQIEDFKKLSKELDVDEIEMGNLQLDPDIGTDWLPENTKYVYETLVGSRRTSPCHWPWSGFTINWDGGMTPCCIVADDKSDFGNVFEENISEIWNNEYFVSARSVFSPDKKITKNTICAMCKNDTHNPNILRIGNTFAITTNPNVVIKSNSTKNE